MTKIRTFCLTFTVLNWVLLTFSSVTSAQELDVCSRPECSRAAASLLQSMNKSVNPCDDFYEFACGNWNKTHSSLSIDSALNSWDVFGERTRTVTDELVASLSKESTIEPDNLNKTVSARKKMRIYYKRCVDATQEPIASVADSLRNHLQNDLFLTDWPRSAQNDVTLDEVIRLLQRSRRFGLNPGLLYRNYVETHPYDATLNIITLDAPELTFDRSWYLEEGVTGASFKTAYHDYALEVAALYKTRMNEAYSQVFLDDVVDDIIQNEKEIMNCYSEEIFFKDHLMSIGTFAIKYSPGISPGNWTRYFSEAFGMNVDLETIINVRQRDFYWCLGMDFGPKTFTASGIRRLFNYAGWKAIESYAPHLDQTFRSARANMFAKFPGSQLLSGPDSCLSQIKEQFPNALASLYIRDHVHWATKSDLKVMVRYITKRYGEVVRTARWMDETMRYESLRKLETITALVGYEGYLENNETRLDSEHDSFNVSGGYLDIYISALRFAVLNHGTELMLGRKPTEWFLNPLSVNSDYNRYINSANFPIALFGPPIYDHALPHYWNFGATGWIIGHEIMHAFDNTNFRIDADGKEQPWANWLTSSEFDRRVDALEQQYSAYNYLGYPLDGYTTKNEDIADNAGLKQAFAAYKSYARMELEDNAEDHLPRFENYTPDQMFFVSYGRTHCGDYRATKAWDILLTYVHSPPRFRLIGTLQNSEDFARAYQCPSGSYMNPVIKNGVF